MKTELYSDQLNRWPSEGRNIMAHYDEQTIVVYQAYNAAIASYAVANQRFGGAFSFSRMSWLKPNFLWMMYRSDWAKSSNQEHVLAITLPRTGFDSLLAQAVESSFQASVYDSHDAWRENIANSEVRLQWDPDHDPHGLPTVRRAVQLGLRGEVLRQYGELWPVEIRDITDFVHEQHRYMLADQLHRLQLPVERVYPVSDQTTASRIRLDVLD